MKRTNIYRAILPILSVMILTACGTDPVLFDGSNAFVAFNKSTSQLTENGDTLLIPVDVAALKGSSAVTVTIEILQDTGATVAVEGVDYTIVSKTLSLPEGLGTAYVEVVPIDNDEFDGNKTFKLRLVSNSEDYPFGTIRVNTVTIEDDEHPLKLVLGDYIYAGLDIDGDLFDCEITTKPVEGDLTLIQFALNDLCYSGYYGIPTDLVVLVSVDLDEMTVKIKTGQSYEDFGYGPCKIFGIDADENELPDDSFVTGTINENGNITLHETLGVLITEGDYQGYTLFIGGPDCVMTKQ